MVWAIRAMVAPMIARTGARHLRLQFPDNDFDGDGVLDCNDNCLSTPNAVKPMWMAMAWAMNAIIAPLSPMLVKPMAIPMASAMVVITA